MKLNMVIVVVVSFTVQFTASFELETVSMYIKLEGGSKTILRVDFYNDMFQRLYKCLEDLATAECDVVIQVYESHTSTTSLKVTDVKSINGSQTCRGYFFTCQYDQPKGILQFTRNTTNQCVGVKITPFPFCNFSVCNNECGYSMRQNPNETYLENCKPERVTTMCATSSQSMETYTLRLNPESHAPAEPSNAAGLSVPNSSLPAIIGAVCIVLFIIVIAFIVIIYRRKKQAKRQASIKRESSSRTDARYTGDPTQVSINRTSGISNIPDVFTIPVSGQGGSRNKSESCYESVDIDCGLSRDELNTVSQHTCDTDEDPHSCELNRNGNQHRLPPHSFRIREESCANSELSRTREGQYYTIEPDDEDVKDSITETEENNESYQYSLVRNVALIELIDVTPEPKNVYSRFGDNNTDQVNLYDTLLQQREVMKSRNNAVGVDLVKQNAEDSDATDVTFALKAE